MGSKYDAFWVSKTSSIRALISAASSGGFARADYSDIRPLGERASWAGTAVVSGAELVSASMAHMVSLGRVAAGAGLCVDWPKETFVFSMSATGALTVRVRSHATAVPAPIGIPDLSTAGPAWTVGVADDVLDPTEACRAIHDAIAPLPRYEDPSDVPFTNGLYFFFEQGEGSAHGRPRITRIGNHPHAQDRLIGRLRDHYATRRDAKNGSVFRRYLGGALLRQDARIGCLEPGPGKGHWESGVASECDACAPYEGRVTERLRSWFTFVCVRIEDQGLRNHLENRLIASVAHCRECRPSEDWLGNLAYREEVRTSGLWNSDSVGGSPATAGDIERLRGLARAPQAGGDDMSDTLLLIPCSAGKRGLRRLSLPTVALSEFLGLEAAALLADGRREAFRRARVNEGSSLIPAVVRYSGQPYGTAGVVDGLLEAMSRGLHVVIVSGGYGLLRAEEPIHDYEAPIQRTQGVWRRRVPVILRNYVTRNGIRRTFGTFSRQYAAVVPDRLCKEDWRAIPDFAELGGGAAMQVVPARVGQLTLSLLERGLVPGEGWERSP